MNNRRQRRWQLKVAGMLRVKNLYNPYTEVGKLWYDKTRQEGKNLQTQNRARIERAREEMLAQKEASIKEGYEASGYSEKQIELMLEGWRLLAVKYPETYREDRKAAQNLFKQAEALNS